MKLLRLLCGLCAQAACTLALAQTPVSQHDAAYQQAIAAYQQQDFATAFNILQPLAERGDATAQNNLAVLYQDGLGVAANPEKALYWYEKAAEQGEAEAQFMAGLMYSDGMGVAQNYEKAVAWYRKAAAQGHAEAMNNLAARYATGTGVAKDYAEAIKWYRQAAAQGHPTAAYTAQQLEQLPERQKQPETFAKPQI